MLTAALEPMFFDH